MGGDQVAEEFHDIAAERVDYGPVGGKEAVNPLRRVPGPVPSRIEVPRVAGERDPCNRGTALGDGPDAAVDREPRMPGQ